MYLVYGILGIDFAQDAERADRVLQEFEIQKLDQACERRIVNREPVAYILNEAWFCGLPFNCDSRALIPRSPIAELISNEFSGLLQSNPQRIMDLCAGGGCIGIACAIRFPEAQVDLVDIDSDCLELASSNIDRHGASGRVRTIQSNLFSGIRESYDLIIANPPYVSAAEVESLPAEFAHEPQLGLLSDEDGLAIPLRILRSAANHLQPDGVLIMEVGYSAERLIERLSPMPLMWLEFAHGGDGVMAITREQLLRYRENVN